MIDGSSIKEPGGYHMTLGKDAIEYLESFTEMATLSGSYTRNPEVKECYRWCEAHLGVKYRDWFMMNNSIYFKNNKSATMFRLTWGHLIISSKTTLDRV